MTVQELLDGIFDMRVTNDGNRTGDGVGEFKTE